MPMHDSGGKKRTLLVMTSTYPRWRNDPEPGFVHELSKRLTSHYRVIVLCPHAAEAKLHETMDEVEIVRYRYAPQRWELLVNNGGIVSNLRQSWLRLLLVPSFLFMQVFSAWRVARAEQVDVIHAHWLIPQGLIAAVLRMLLGRHVPFLVTSHGADIYALNGPVLDAIKRFVARRADAVTVVSGAMSEVMTDLGVDMTKVSVAPMGVDISSRFFPDPNVTRSAHELLFVGRLVEKKGLRYLLDALPLVLESVPDAHLTIAGFGPQEAALKSQARELGLLQAVSFLGAVPQLDLPSLYCRAALFVTPFVQAQSGDQEGFGLVLIEATGCGCPALVGDVPAVREILGAGFDDMVVDPKCVKGFADQIIARLSNKRDARARAVQLGESVRERFDWNIVAARYLTVLQQCMQGQGS